MVYVGRYASEGSAGAAVVACRGGLGLPMGGVPGELVAGQIGRGLVYCIGGGRIALPLGVLLDGKNLSCSSVIWHTCFIAGANMFVMRSVLTNRSLPS